MTLFADGLESGIQGITSAQSTRAHVRCERYRRFTGGGNQTWTGFFPAGATGIRPTLHICTNGSTATSDRIVISLSAGSTTLLTYSSFGSANGIVGTSTIVSLATVAPIVSAMATVGPNTEGADVPFQVILSSVDTATDYQIFIDFMRPFKPGS